MKKQSTAPKFLFMVIFTCMCLFIGTTVKASDHVISWNHATLTPDQATVPGVMVGISVNTWDSEWRGSTDGTYGASLPRAPNNQNCLRIWPGGVAMTVYNNSATNLVIQSIRVHSQRGCFGERLHGKRCSGRK